MKKDLTGEPMKVTQKTLKKALVMATNGCVIQHNGWPCGTCFFSISTKLTNKDWQAVLLFRGDYAIEDLRNLPKNLDKSIQKVFALASAKNKGGLQ